MVEEEYIVDTSDMQEAAPDKAESGVKFRWRVLGSAERRDLFQAVVEIQDEELSGPIDAVEPTLHSDLGRGLERQ